MDKERAPEVSHPSARHNAKKCAAPKKELADAVAQRRFCVRNVKKSKVAIDSINWLPSDVSDHSITN